MPLAHRTGVVPEVRPLPEEETAFVSIQTTTILARLLPDATLLRLEACAIDDATSQITLAVRSTQATAPCPLCTTPARRIHSDYERTLADLPWAHYHVRLQLRVRKWFCRNRHCPRRIFTERLPTVAAPWPGAPSGWLNASSLSASRWAGGLGYTPATRGTWR